MQFDRTIAAISTAPLNAALGLVRLSGADALSIADRLFHAKSGKPLRETPGGRAVYGELRRDGLLDQVVATVFRAPHSFTGEDTVEFCCHGGVQLLSAVLSALLECGAAPAQPGEFSKRAFLNGKLDLAQAEAVIDLISARSQRSASLASCQLDGALSREMGRLRQALLDADGQLMAALDYPEEELEELSFETLVRVLRETERRIGQLLATYPLGQAIRDGVDTAILGKPNAGKSSLMNLLAGYDRSIVTEVPGTTRDFLEEQVQVGELLLNLADTAGIRETQDQVEKLGVQRALDRAGRAALLLCVFDSSLPASREDLEICRLARDRQAVAILNKSDLPAVFDRSLLEGFSRTVSLSALTGEGLGDLTAALKELFRQGLEQDELLLTNARHRDCLLRAQKLCHSCLSTLEAGYEADLAEPELRQAVEALGEITGQSASQDLLDNIFSRFCVGK